jgi:hypothetical protein
LPLDVSLDFHTTLAHRTTVARLNHRGHQIRAIVTSGIENVASVIRWSPYPEQGMPASGLGMSWWSLPFVRSMASHPRAWAGSLRRVPGVNPAAAVDPSLVPGIRCGAHVTFSLTAGTAWSTRALVRGGAAAQRAWLFTTGLGLATQPNLAPVVYTWADTDCSPLSLDRHAGTSIKRLAVKSRAMYERIGTDESRVFFQCRLGYPTSPCPTRSLRHPADALWGSSPKR